MKDSMATATPATIERLQALLAEKGWSATKLSTMAGLGKGAVNDLLTSPDRTPREGTLAKLARTLGVDREYLSGESEVRRAASRLHKGPAWQDLEGLDAFPLLEKLDIEIDGSGDDLRAYHLPPGADALGVPADSTVILRQIDKPQTGDLVVVFDSRDGLCIRYLAEPYLIGLDSDGRVRHWLKSESAAVMGKIVLTVKLP